MRRQTLFVACAGLFLFLAGASSIRSLAGPEAVEAGFWFEDGIHFESSRLGTPLAAAEITTIESVARAELREAFRGLRLSITGRRDARYTLRVVQEVRDLRFRRPVGVAGQSRGIRGIGGSGSVSFDFLANGAMAWAADDTDRAGLVAAIGRGIGRTAVHEFVHQLLPTAPIHDSRDDRSYEFSSAARLAQYYGPMRWHIARPLLEQRIGS